MKPGEFENEIAARSGTDADVVDRILYEQDLFVREFVSEGVAVFHSLGVECERGHPAQRVVGDWPLDSMDNWRAELERSLGCESSNRTTRTEQSEIVGEWAILPDRLLECDESIEPDHYDVETFRLVLTTFWKVAAENDVTELFVDHGLGADEQSILETIRVNPELLVEEFGPGDFEDVSQLGDGLLTFRPASGGRIVGIMIETSRASKKTLAMADQALSDLALMFPTESVSLAIFADGRNADYRRAAALRPELFYRGLQDLIWWGAMPASTDSDEYAESVN